jgi:hypothetical protein
MTEQEWLACDDPKPMLEFLQGKASERKLRLFACACCRRIWRSLPNATCREAVELSERFGDGLADAEALRQAQDAAGKAAWADADRRRETPGGPATPSRNGRSYEAVHCATFSQWCTYSTIHSCVVVGSAAAADAAAWQVGGVRERVRTAERSRQALILRDLFGNPFRPSPPFDRSWLTPTVISLAIGAYEERALPSGELDPARLAVLSDALEEAGCTDAVILDHLRSPGTQVRGCWVLDLCLGRR